MKDLVPIREVFGGLDGPVKAAPHHLWLRSRVVVDRLSKECTSQRSHHGDDGFNFAEWRFEE